MELPEQVVVKIVEEHLSFADVCRSQCVSKAWQELMRMPNRARSDGDYYLTAGSKLKNIRLWNVKDGAVKAWVVSMDFLSDDNELAGATPNGLLLVQNKTRIGELVVTNAFTRNTLRLPDVCDSDTNLVVFLGIQAIDEKEFLVAMVRAKSTTGRSSLSYERQPVHVHVYDSRKSQWELKAVGLDENEYLTANYMDFFDFKCSTIYGSRLYFMTATNNTPECKASLRCLDLVDQQRNPAAAGSSDSSTTMLTWTSKSLPSGIEPMHPDTIDCWEFSLHICQGRIILACMGALEQNEDDEEVGTLVVLALDERTKSWNHLTSLPLQYALEMCCSKMDRMVVADNGEKLIVNSRSEGGSYVYDVSTNTWDRVQVSGELLFPCKPSLMD